MVATSVEVKQCRMGNLQLVEKAPEMIDMPAAERNHRHRCVVLGDAGGRQDTWQDHLLAIAFTEHYEPREVQLGIGLDRLTYVLGSRLVVLGKDNAVYGRLPGSVQAQKANRMGVDTAQ